MPNLASTNRIEDALFLAVFDFFPAVVFEGDLGGELLSRSFLAVFFGGFNAVFDGFMGVLSKLDRNPNRVDRLGMLAAQSQESVRAEAS